MAQVLSDTAAAAWADERSADQQISRCRALLWCAAVLTGLLQAWAFRHGISPDGISYLDIAQSCAQGDWHSLVNGYWSPLYPFLLSVVFLVLKPSPLWESTVAHFANFGFFILSFVCFETFVKALIRYERRRSEASAEGESMPEWALWVLGDSLFICFTLLFIHMERLQPDLLVGALVYLAAALLLRIRAGESGWLTYAGFGATLGVAYLAKAVMFPLAIVFLGCGLFAVKPSRRAILGTALSLAVFLLVGAPFIAALSKEKGRATYGDVGKIAYAEFVGGVTHFIHWQGGPEGAGWPVHPTRDLRDRPSVYEFSAPIEGTYPPWYDPSYWYEGVVAQFKLGNQLRAIRYTIEEYVAILPFMSGVFVAFLGMAIVARASGLAWKGWLAMWPVWAPAVAALGLYGLVYLESRYVIPFFLLLWMSLFAGLRFTQWRAVQTVVRPLVLATALMLCTGIAWLAGRAMFRALHPQPFVDWEVAQSLQRMGVRPGDRVSSIGFALEAYWAHLAGVRIVAEIPLGEAPSFWASPASIQSEVFADFAKAGAKVVVTDQGVPLGAGEGWQRIGQTNYFVHELGAGAARNQAAR